MVARCGSLVVKDGRELKLNSWPDVAEQLVEHLTIVNKIKGSNLPQAWHPDKIAEIKVFVD